jgi:uncharacterized protein (UPF0276 family)
MATMQRRAGAPVGVGLQHPHLPQVLGEPGSRLDFFEVHAENLMVDGGPLPRRIEQVRQRHRLSLHGVGLSLGGSAPPDPRHLARLAALVRRFEPDWVSEHLAWSGEGGRYFADLLPLPYDDAALHRVAEHVDRLQAALQRRVLVENPSTYVRFAQSTYGEGEFLAALVRRTGCGVLLDVNNAHVSAVNHGEDARALIDALPVGAVGEYHLAGHTEERLPGGRLLVDTHAAPVAEPVWALLRHAVRRHGPQPALIERDRQVPPLAELEAEALRARREMAACLAPAPLEACA